MPRDIYLDNHATTQTDPRVVEAMLPYFTTYFGNPGSIGHSYGDQARSAVEDSRNTIAKSLNVSAQEIIFTSGATESNNLAIRGVADRIREERGHFVSMTTEHKAVLDPLARLERQGFDVTLLTPIQAPDKQAGLLPAPSRLIADSLREDTRLVTIMLANNEVGTIQPIQEIAKVCREHNVPLHCDATQAIGKVAVDVSELDVDMLSLSAHKMYGPRGVGALVVRRRRPRIRLQPLIEGGGQEQGRRSGTLNVPGIVGLAEAIRISDAERDAENQRVSALRDSLCEKLMNSLDDVTLNGPEFSDRLCGNLNLQFQGVDGEALMMNMKGVAVSSGSACTSANPEPSHVLRAIGLSEDATRSSLRFGIGRFNTEEDIAAAAEIVISAVKRLRSLG